MTHETGELSVRRVEIVDLAGRNHLEVGACAEGHAVRAGKDRCPDLRIGFNLLHRRVEAVRHGAVDGIARFLPIDRDQRDMRHDNSECNGVH